MPTAQVNGVNIYYEVTGEGFPLIFSHEFAGSCRSWEAQVRFFSRRYRVITYNHRGYPPSEVPGDPNAYSHEASVEDLYQLLRHLGVGQAYVCGLSMGGNVALNLGLAHPQVCRTLVVAGCGAGTVDRERFVRDVEQVAQRLEREGMAAIADEYARGPTRLPFLRKDPRGWQEFRDEFAAHSALGSAHTFRGVQLGRPTIFQLEPKLVQLSVPTLIVVGDEDEPCLEPALFMKRKIPNAGLAVFPQTGHTLNLEEPDLFNRTVLDFLTVVEAGNWAPRAEVSTSLLPPRARK